MVYFLRYADSSPQADSHLGCLRDLQSEEYFFPQMSVPELGQRGPGWASLFLQKPLHVPDWASSQSGRITRVRFPPLLLRPSVPGNTSISSRVSHDLGSEITECHFSHSLYIKISYYRDPNGGDYTKIWLRLFLKSSIPTWGELPQEWDLGKGVYLFDSCSQRTFRQETQVWSLGEDSLEEELAIHSSILA